jgi:hypothetical protein
MRPPLPKNSPSRISPRRRADLDQLVDESFKPRPLVTAVIMPLSRLRTLQSSYDSRRFEAPHSRARPFFM